MKQVGTFTVKYSKDEGNKESFLKDVIKLDESLYSEEDLGTPERILARYQKNRDSYINIYDGKELIAYICFFPITKDLREKMYTTHKIFEDNINPTDIVSYEKGKNHTLFIIAIDVRKDYQDGEAIKVLTNEFIAYLKEKEEQEYFVDRILTYASREEGFKIFKTLNFHQVERFEDNSRLFDCKRPELRLQDYEKSYQNDLYIMIPYSTNQLSFETISREPENEFAKEYLESIHANSKYECDYKIVEDLSRFYLGKKQLVYYSNEYDDNIYGLIDVDLFITYHKNTNLLLLTMMTLHSEYSPTQIQDQVTSNRLAIKEGDTILDFNEYLKKEYHMDKICNGKMFVSTSNSPKDDIELEYLLASEAYLGKRNDYLLNSKEFKEQANHDFSQYDFCEIYGGIDSIVYVMKDFSNNSLNNIRKETLILYIMEVIMFQKASVLRTNNKIVEELDSDGKVTLSNIEELYTEFGKTISLWNINIFNYPAVQNIANHISRCFETNKDYEEYTKNQKFLEHIVNLRDIQNSNREDKILNGIVLLLTIIQVIPLIISFQDWINHQENNFELILSFGLVLLLLLSILMLTRRRKKKRSKRKDI